MTSCARGSLLTLTSEPAGGEREQYSTVKTEAPQEGRACPAPTGDVPADVLHPAHVVLMPVGDEDLLDAGVELLQRLFEAADVFRHSSISSVDQHSSGIYLHTFSSEENKVI